jgi:hypothetical protein
MPRTEVDIIMVSSERIKRRSIISIDLSQWSRRQQKEAKEWKWTCINENKSIEDPASGVGEGLTINSRGGLFYLDRWDHLGAVQIFQECAKRLEKKPGTMKNKARDLDKMTHWTSVIPGGRICRRKELMSWLSRSGNHSLCAQHYVSRSGSAKKCPRLLLWMSIIPTD